MEKLLKNYTEADLERKQVDAVIQARRKGNKNETSTDFTRALNHVNQDHDLAMSVKLSIAPSDLANC